MKLTDPLVVKKTVLIALVVCGAIYIGQPGTLIADKSPMGMRPVTMTQDDIYVAPLPSSRVMDGGETRLNGMTSESVHARTDMSIVQVLEAFKRRAERDGAKLEQNKLTKQMAVANYRKGDKFIGLVAFPTPKGGTSYMIGETPQRMLTGTQGDVKGAEAPDVPRPEQTRRSFSLEKPRLGNSIMNYYNSSLSAPAIQRFYMAEMPKHGWQFDQKAFNASQRWQGATVMLFDRGREQCIIGLSEDGQGGNFSVLYRQLQ